MVHYQDIHELFGCIAESSAFVGFTAAMAADDALAYSTNQLVEFPVVLANFGNWYNPQFHEFTCPVNGVYLFTVSTLGDTAKLGVVNIMVNRDSKVTAFADGRGSGIYGHSTNQVITECDQGGKVWIRSDRDMTVHDNTRNYGTFSGLLLHTL